MAGTLHSTDRTTAATGWFSFSLATYHTNNDSRYHDNQNNTDDDCRHIFNKPCKHLIPPVINIFPGWNYHFSTCLPHFILLYKKCLRFTAMEFLNILLRQKFLYHLFADRDVRILHIHDNIPQWHWLPWLSLPHQNRDSTNVPWLPISPVFPNNVFFSCLCKCKRHHVFLHSETFYVEGRKLGYAQNTKNLHFNSWFCSAFTITSLMARICDVPSPICQFLWNIN